MALVTISILLFIHFLSLVIKLLGRADNHSNNENDNYERNACYQEQK